VILKSFSRGLRFPQTNVPDFALRHADGVRLMDLNHTAEAVRFCDELHARLRDTYEGPA
jgi:hypothetical protein